MVDDETPLRSALQGLLDRYLTMVNSGDCGNWEPEDEAEVIAARKALKTSSTTMHDAAKATEERAWPDDLEKPT